MKLANVNLKQLFLDKWAYVSVVLRQVVSSLVATFLVAYLPVAEVVKYTIFFLFSMPSATSTAMFAIRFGADGDFASVSVLLSTVLSVITVPLMFLLFQAVV
jgi:predicted permease